MGQIARPRPGFDPFPNTPRGSDLPIACKYPFGPGEELEDKMIPPKWDIDIPKGWTTQWILHTDPRLEEAGFTVGEVWVNKETQTAFFEKKPGTEPVGYLFLLNGDEIVATWDEGRWWTPEESKQFDLMLRVAATIDLQRLGPHGEFGKGAR
jgi:hypothetical protein